MSTTISHLEAHRVFVFLDDDATTQFVSGDTYTLGDARTEIARYDHTFRARVSLTPDPLGAYLGGPCPEVAELLGLLAGATNE